MSRGPGRWQKQLLSAVSGTVVASVSGVVRAAVVTPDRDDFTSARRAARQLALVQRVSAVYVHTCPKCGRMQDSDIPEPCCAPVRAMLAVCQPERRRLLLHPAPAPGGRVPSWINVVPSARPAGQLSVASVEDLAASTLRRAYERVEAGEAEVTIRDAVAIFRLAHEVERDEALAERDAARRQMGEWRDGLWVIRNAIVRQYGQDAWVAISAEVRKLRPVAPRYTGAT